MEHRLNDITALVTGVNLTVYLSPTEWNYADYHFVPPPLLLQPYASRLFIVLLESLGW